MDARYKRLGFSGEKGNRLKVNLIAAGILEEQAVRVGRTRRVLLRPTAKAKKELGLAGGNIERGSLVHEYWKRFYAGKFKKMGYNVELEAPRRGGRVDVLATKASESVAITQRPQSRLPQRNRATTSANQFALALCPRYLWIPRFPTLSDPLFCFNQEPSANLPSRQSDSTWV